MTLENCKRLLKHFNDLADGTIPRPFGHKNWADVISNAKQRAKIMEERISHKLTLPRYAHLKPKMEVKKVAKKST